MQQYERDFIEYYFAYSFFRIPEFQKELLDCFKDVEESKQVDDYKKEVIGELGGSEKIGGKQPGYVFEVESIFNWENEFFRYFKDLPEYKENLIVLKEALALENWRKRFTKRASGFFFFIQQLSSYIQKSLITKDGIPYSDIPGYSKIVKTFLIELKEKDIKGYPDSMVDASVALLDNTRLLNPFCGIILQKTR